MVDTGYFLSDERSSHGRIRPDVLVKNDWVFKAYSQFAVDVANISSHDLRYFSTALEKTESARRVAAESLLARLVSANTLTEAAGFSAPRPFIVREIPSRQPGSKPVRVAFIGLTETTPAAPPGFKFVDPAEAARRIVPEAKKQANLVVVLAKVTSEKEVARIAREAPGIDVIIDGNSQGLEEAFTTPYYVGQTLVVFTPFETRMLGELRFYKNAQGKFTTKQRFIVLDEIMIPEDPEAKQLVAAATIAEADARKDSKTLLEKWLASSRTLATGRSAVRDSAESRSSPAYATSAACSQCHLEQYMKWTNSAHAHATDPLPPRPIEFEISCLECHATGFKRAGATDELEVAKLQNVQCEQCHGPGSNHVAKPAKGYGRITNMRNACASCHTAETSPAFDLQAAWTRIKH